MNLASLILADPPWPYNDRKETRRDNPGKAPKFGIGVERRYSAGTMTEGALFDMGHLVANAARPDAYLLCWATCPRLDAAIALMKFWGFPCSTVHAVWVKTYPGLWEELESGRFAKGLPPEEIGPAAIDLLLRSIFRGPGRYSPSNVELLLLGTRGGCWHPNTGFKPRQVMLESHPREGGKIIHSRKPEVFQDELDRWLRPHAQGPFLELFATRRRPGWNCLGHALTQTDIRADLQGLVGQGSLFADHIDQNSTETEEAPCPNN